jgi:Protein of unknown function (DUF3604)
VKIKMLNEDIPKLMKEKTVSGLGHLDIGTKQNIKTDSWNEYIISYTCNQTIAPGGSLRITIPHFFTTPQIENSAVVGYTCLAPQNEIKAEISINPTYSCFFTDDGHSGRFGKNIFVRFPEGAKNGQKLIIKYGAQTEKNRGAKAPFFACGVYFITAVDPYGDRRANISGYYLLDKQTGFEITGKNAKKAMIFIPAISQSGIGEGIIHLTDLNDNIDPVFEGELKLFSDNSTVELPDEIVFAKKDKGIKTFPFKNLSGKDFRVEVVSDDIAGTSNFCAGKRDDQYNVYWGEYHVHTYASDGLGTIKEALDYGRKDAALDFASVNDHLDFTDESWEITKRDTEAANAPGKFVTFFGFEVTTRPNGCDYCLISPEKDLDIKELMSCKKDSQYHQPIVSTEKYYETMAKQNVIIIPHFHLGNGAIWNYQAPPQMKLAEIYSCWGAHEYEDCALPSYGLSSLAENEKDKNTIHELLNNKYKCGFVAGSDSHSGQTGKTKWLRSKQRYKGGLSAVMAKDLTRESLWEALQNRRVYATTGARIYLDFRINNALMGSEIKIKKGSNINLSLKVNGVETTFLTQIIKNNKTWKSFDVATYPNPPAPGCEGIFEKEISDEQIGQSACYYLRVTQIDGEIAWSSPIWVDVE